MLMGAAVVAGAVTFIFAAYAACPQELADKHLRIIWVLATAAAVIPAVMWVLKLWRLQPGCAAAWRCVKVCFNLRVDL